MLCTALVVVIVLLSVMRVSAVGVFTVCVVIRVCVSYVLVYVTGIGMTFAPFPSVGNWNSNVDWLYIWETDRQRRYKCWIRNSSTTRLRWNEKKYIFLILNRFHILENKNIHRVMRQDHYDVCILCSAELVEQIDELSFHPDWIDDWMDMPHTCFHIFFKL